MTCPLKSGPASSSLLSPPSSLLPSPAVTDAHAFLIGLRSPCFRSAFHLPLRPLQMYCCHTANAATTAAASATAATSFFLPVYFYFFICFYTYAALFHSPSCAAPNGLLALPTADVRGQCRRRLGLRHPPPRLPRVLRRRCQPGDACVLIAC